MQSAQSVLAPRTDQLGELMTEDVCPRSKRVDGPKHSFRFDGDDPYIECVYCGEYRDALSGRVIRTGT